MALPDLQIDDRTYDQLFAVLRKGLPANYTDHNPSDPAITLLELFCWLGEMSLYGMNRTPQEHENKFRDLLVDPPVPATVPVTFAVQHPGGGSYQLKIPAGTKVATDFINGRRSVFETFKTVTLPVPNPATNPPVIPVREFLEVTDERLGTADGRPHQAFPLKPVHSQLGLALDAPAPVLVDYVNRSLDYDPNPQIRVFRGLLNGISGAFSGIVAADLDAEPTDTAYFLTFAPPNLTLTRADGVSESVPVAAGPIAAGQTETVVFPTLRARITLSSAFDKTVAPTPTANLATVTGGSGSILPASMSIVATTGSVRGITSTDLTLSLPANPAELTLNLATGYSGIFDGSTTGLKRVVLRDAEGNALTVEFNVAAAFNGTETGAILRIGRLAHLLVFGGEIWTAQPSLLTEVSKKPDSHHVRIDPIARTIHFGDGTFGALPPAGAPILCRRYQLLRGPASLIGENQIRHLLSVLDTLAAGDSITVANLLNAAFGGEHFYNADQRLAAGLEDFRRPYRLVTTDDFERVLLQDFNEYQKLAGRPERIARATAVMNRMPPLSADTPKPGNVTVMVLRQLSTADQAVWDNPVSTLATRQALLGFVNPLDPVDPLDLLPRYIKRFIEERRLITTHVHVVAPTLVEVRIDVSFVIEPHRNVTEMETLATKRVLNFLDLLEGGFDARGWPLGRDVYRSEIFRLIEELDGIDHIDALSLSPANSDGDVAIQPHQLPFLQTLHVAALRP